jgi:biotin-dependent carboxylase-like uncharacterized protein
MMFEFLEVISPGCGASFQDAGRPGWKRFGVPPGGWMDPGAAALANALIGNPADAVVIELALQGARFRVLADGWLSMAGASMGWRPGTVRKVSRGEELSFIRHESGVYAYVAAPGGWAAPEYLGSSAVSARSGLGRGLTAGEVISGRTDPIFRGPERVARAGQPAVHPPTTEACVWPGPQWSEFSAAARSAFFATEWRVSARSDRMGVRLDGASIEVPAGTMLSEPVLVGSVQITGGGQPVVTMRDGPTVGGYPKIGWLDEDACCRVAQVPPGGTLRFRPLNQ